MGMPKRCAWVGDDHDMIHYHDCEWGKPVYDAQKLFELLCLEGAQAGLSWKAILKKRQAYQQAFYQFNIKRVAAIADEQIDSLLQSDSGIVRNRMKINSVVNNAQCWLKLANSASVVDLLWQFADGKPSKHKQHSDIPVSTQKSKQMSQFLKANGFKFVGEIICYSFMQASGMVNDHIMSCEFR